MLSNNAYKEIWEKHHKGLISYAQARLNDKMYAEDIVQVVFSKLINKIRYADTMNGIVSWLYVCVKHDVYNYNLHRERMGMLLTRITLTDEDIAEDSPEFEDKRIFPATDETPETIIIRHELIALICKEIEEMPKGRKKVGRLMMLGYNQKEIAEILGLNYGGINTQAKRVKDSLREKFCHLFDKEGKLELST